MNNNYEHNYGTAYANTLPTLGQVITQVLQFFGVDIVYGVGGDFAANLISALEDGVELAPASNEMHAGFCACGDAEINGISAALTTYTVGSLPCGSAAALAKAEKLPVVFISGAPGEGEINQLNIHHTVAAASDWKMSYDAALESFAALGIKAVRLQGARNKYQAHVAGERFFQLVKHAYLNKEPVFIEVPRDLVASKTQAIQLPTSLDMINDSYFALAGGELIADNIIQRLNKSQLPLVYIGENLKLNKPLIRLIVQFCKRKRIPYATSWLAKGIVDEQDDLCLGAYNGVFSDPSHREYIEKHVDYIIDVDTSISPCDIAIAFNTGTHHIDTFDNKTVLKGCVPNQQGLIEIFKHLLRADVKDFADSVNNKLASIIDAPKMMGDSKRIGFDSIAVTLNQIQQNEARSLIFLPEVGNSFFASYGLHTKQSELSRSWITNPWYGAMGTSLPYARAVAKRLRQHRSNDRAVILTGDGGFHFQLNELIHFQREQLDVVIVYMRNNIFHLGKSSEASIYHCSTPEFDVQTLIKAYGGQARQCETICDFKQGFADALEQGGIQLIEVTTSTEPEHQCREIQLLNLYIKNQNGDPQAMEQWRQLML